MYPRPLLRLTLAFVAGIAAGHALRPPPGLPLALGLAGLGLALVWSSLDGRRPYRAGARVHAGRVIPPALLAATLCAGAFMATLAWERIDPLGAGEPEPPARWVLVAGRIVSEPKPTSSGYSFLLRADLPGRYWRAGETLYVAVRRPGMVIPVRAGDRAEIRGFLARPRRPGNPGEFDFPRYLATAGVRYLLSTGSDPAPLGGGAAGGFTSFCRVTRDTLMAGVAEALPPDEASLLAGLLFGDTSRLPEDAARDFRRAGVYHILAVSGSNVAFVAGGFWLAARILLRFAGLRGPRSRRVLWPATAVVLAAYAVMSGLGPSVTRATLMAEAGLVYLWLGRRRDVSGPLCLAALVMLWRRPLLILDPGFELSFAATLGIFTVYPPLGRWGAGVLTPRVPTRLRRPVEAGVQAALVSLAAQAAVLPVLAWHFGEVSVVGLLANVIVVPLSGLAVTLGLAAGVLHLGGAPGRLFATPVFWVTSLLLRGATGTAHVLAGAPFASVITGRPAAWVVALYYLALAWVVRGAAGGRAGRRAALVLVFALAGYVGFLAAGAIGGAVSPATAGGSGGVGWSAGPALEVTFLDVGQGDAAFIRLSGGHTVLVDGGPAGAGERVIAPYLRYRGVGHLDIIFVTHLHDDHIAGLVDLLADPGITVGEITVAAGVLRGELPPPAAALVAEASRRRIPIREVAAGAALVAGRRDVSLTVLWPPAAQAASSENNGSLVLLLAAPAASFLLAGDLEATGEEALLAHWQERSEGWGPGRGLDDGGLTILKVGHHGSSYSTGPALLAAVRPTVAVISVGRNSFGHPSPRTQARLAQAGAAVFLTRTDGAVTFLVRGGRLTVRGFRSGREFRCGQSGRR